MKKIFTGLLLMVALTFGVLAQPAPAFADAATEATKQQVCQGIAGAGGDCASGGTDLSDTMKAILNIMSVIAGFAAVLMVIISGFKYITSGGDTQSVSSAKRTLIYAIVGVVVVAFSQVLVHFVLTQTAP